MPLKDLEARKQFMKEYRLKNKEKIKEYNRDYYLKNIKENIETRPDNEKKNTSVKRIFPQVNSDRQYVKKVGGKI
jgi:hypothetical protein